MRHAPRVLHGELTVYYGYDHRTEIKIWNIYQEHKGEIVYVHRKQKKPPNNIASGAVFLCSRQFFNFFGEIFDSQTDFSAEIMPLMKKKANCYKTDLFFIDIGTLGNLQLADQFAAFQNESVLQ